MSEIPHTQRTEEGGLHLTVFETLTLMLAFWEFIFSLLTFVIVLVEFKTKK